METKQDWKKNNWGFSFLHVAYISFFQADEMYILSSCCLLTAAAWAQGLLSLCIDAGDIHNLTTSTTSIAKKKKMRERG